LGHACISDDCGVVYDFSGVPSGVNPSFKLLDVCEIVLITNRGNLGWVSHQGILLHVPSAVCSFRENVLSCVASRYFEGESSLQNSLSDVQSSLDKNAHR